VFIVRKKSDSWYSLRANAHNLFNVLPYGNWSPYCTHTIRKKKIQSRNCVTVLFSQHIIFPDDNRNQFKNMVETHSVEVTASLCRL
jgi:hypothetical protein